MTCISVDTLQAKQLSAGNLLSLLWPFDVMPPEAFRASDIPLSEENLSHCQLNFLPVLLCVFFDCNYKNEFLNGMGMPQTEIMSFVKCPNSSWLSPCSIKSLACVRHTPSPGRPFLARFFKLSMRESAAVTLLTASIFDTTFSISVLSQVLAQGQSESLSDHSCICIAVRIGNRRCVAAQNYWVKSCVTFEICPNASSSHVQTSFNCFAALRHESRGASCLAQPHSSRLQIACATRTSCSLMLPGVQ